MFVEHIVNFAWRDIFTTTNDQFLGATGDENIAILVFAAKVAGEEPAVAQRCLCRFRVLVIIVEQVAAANDQLTYLLRRTFLPVLVDDDNFIAVRQADRARLARRGRQWITRYRAGGLG